MPTMKDRNRNDWKRNEHGELVCEHGYKLANDDCISCAVNSVKGETDFVLALVFAIITLTLLLTWAIDACVAP